MVVGGGILSIALTDNLLSLIVKGEHRLTRDPWSIKFRGVTL